VKTGFPDSASGDHEALFFDGLDSQTSPPPKNHVAIDAFDAGETFRPQHAFDKPAEFYSSQSLGCAISVGGQQE
jgi:hypothetical protein